MSFDDNCVDCKQHLYAFPNEDPRDDHLPWCYINEGAICISCLRNRYELKDGMGIVRASVQDEVKKFIHSLNLHLDDVEKASVTVHYQVSRPLSYSYRKEKGISKVFQSGPVTTTITITDCTHAGKYID